MIEALSGCSSEILPKGFVPSGNQATERYLFTWLAARHLLPFLFPLAVSAFVQLFGLTNDNHVHTKDY